MDCFYFKNFFFNTHFVCPENYFGKQNYHRCFIHMALVTVSIFTIQLSCHWFTVWHKCFSTGWSSKQVAFFFFNCLWTDLRVYKETTLQSHPHWPFVSLGVCVWVQFLSFPFDGYYLPPVFLKKISEHNDLILMQVTLRVWQVIFIARPLAYQAF